MNCILLGGKWTGSSYTFEGNREFTFDATVPGCVHTDLINCGIISDIYYRDNADKYGWIEERNWKYEKVFRLEELPEKASLVFEGLDTYAEITLNGISLGETDNMFIRHRFEASKLLKKGENTLTVFFRSPVREVEGLPDRPGAFTVERMHTRRIQCTYGWDWVARFVTCGIWREVYLDLTDGFTVKNAYVYTEAIYGDTAQIAVEAETESFLQGGFIDLKIKDPEGKTVVSRRYFCKEPNFKDYFDIPNALLWYPHGYGEQPIYTLEICGKEYRFGIRTAVISQIPDQKDSEYYKKCLKIKDSVSGKIYDFNEEFSGFCLLINGIPIMCKGANWVPCEPFPSAESDQKITTLLTLAKEAGLNMLRIWGGGIFEKQHFYSECDRLGILTTQDFLMACGHYPEERTEFIDQLKKETEFAAYELRNHPCLVWWSGDNENAVMGHDEAEDYRGRTAINKAIMPILARLDPRRRFLLSSPYGGRLYASKTVGTTHNTQYLGESIFPYILETDMKDYKEHFATYLARFIAEEPTTGAICLPSLRRFMTEEEVFGSKDMWEYHTKSNPGLPYSLFSVLESFTKKVLGDFTDGKDRFFKLKYNQFEWIRVSMENIRRNKGFINGIIYWMWNDCWPASSGWAFVDYYCLPKASFYSFKRCAGELLASVDKTDTYNIYLCNDGLDSKNVSIKLSYVQNGKAVAITEKEVEIPAAESAKVLKLPLSVMPEDAMLICDAECGNLRDRAFYREGTLPIIPCEAPKISLTENSITLTADSYIHAVEIEGEFVFEDNYFSLMPGESRTVAYRPAENALTSELSITAYTL